MTADHGLTAAPGYFIVMTILDWWDNDLPPGIRRDIEGGGAEPACITRARRFLKTKNAVTALQSGPSLPAFRCDNCDNGVEIEWEFCAWCGRGADNSDGPRP